MTGLKFKIEKLIGNWDLKIGSSNDGFTLIETLIYSVILAIFIGAAFSFIASILGTTDTLLERNEVLANQDFAERKIYWILGQSAGIAVPGPNSSGTILAVQGSDTAIYPASLTLSNNQIMLALPGKPATALTNNRVQANLFFVQTFNNSQTSSTLAVTFGLNDAAFSNIQSSTTIFYVFPQN